MGWEAWATIGTVVLVLASLALTHATPDLIFVGAVTLLLAAGIIDAKAALSGLSNPDVITVGVLYVVAAGLRETGVMSSLAQRLLGRPDSIRNAQIRMAAPVAAMSAFVNNTPIVAMWLPVIDEWAKKHNISPSKLLLPLSYAAILGGVCTLIGTSTNLIVSGLLNQLADHKTHLQLFDLVPVGIPCAVVGLLFLVIGTPWLLRDRRGAVQEFSDPKEYSVEMLVEPGSPLIGKTIEEAGLRQLRAMYLLEIDRDGDVIVAVGPQERLKANDRLVFVGIVESVLELHKTRGLKPATDQVFKLDAPRARRTLIEAVVSNTCPLVGMTVREGRFRTNYNAAIIAVARNGERIHKKIGDIELQPGDTLLLEAHPSFVEQQSHSRDFYLVSRVQGYTAPRHERAGIAAAIFLGMVITAGTGILTMLQAAMLAAGLMILTRCLSSAAARASVDWQVLVAIAASFGLGHALKETGVAQTAAQAMLSVAGQHPWFALIAVYVLTVVFTELMSNNAAAVLMFPLALATAQSLGVSYMPFTIAIMFAASFGFATPLGYQTHLMVYGPGGYRLSDFLRVGIPMDILMGVISVTLIPWVWPFTPAVAP